MSALLWCFYWDLGLEISLCLTCTTLPSFCDCCRKQRPRMWTYVYPARNHSDIKPEDGRWKEEAGPQTEGERERKGVRWIGTLFPRRMGRKAQVVTASCLRQRNPPEGKAPAQVARACVLLSHPAPALHPLHAATPTASPSTPATPATVACPP